MFTAHLGVPLRDVQGVRREPVYVLVPLVLSYPFLTFNSETSKDGRDVYENSV